MTETIRAAKIVDQRIIALLVEQITDYAIFLLTPAGEIASWNPGAERIKGYKPDEIIGKNFVVFYPPQDQAARKPQQELEAASRDGRFEDEGWRVRKDGSLFWANVIITAIRSSEGTLLGYGKVTRDLTERRKSEEQVRELSSRILSAQDEERARVGRELHDTVGQYLVAAKMSVESLLAGDSQLTDEMSQRITDSAEIIERSMKEVRTLSYLLYPPMLEEMGLASAIPWFLEGFSKRSGIEITFENNSQIERLPRGIELALFRVMQESLTNVHRHSQSTTAQIRLTAGNGEARIEITDRGRGFQSDEVAFDSASIRKLGVGIRGMRERVQHFGGKLEIQSGQQGTTIEAVIPVTHAES